MANFTQVGVEAVVKGYKSFMGNLGSMGKAVGGFGVQAAKMAAVGVAAAGAAVAGLGIASLKVATDYESAFAGVLKTTDGLGDGILELTEDGKAMLQGFRDATKEIPVAFEDLAAIGELGGQLGVASEDLLGFTKAIAAMGESTNLSGEAAAAGIAQIFNAAGQIPITEAAVNDFGSAIVALGNNSATTEADIVNFTQRIAGAGQVAGLSLADMAGIGAAFASVGVEAQAGGTAVSKVLQTMATATEEQMAVIAAVSDMTVEEFQAKWETDAAGAFAEFTKGIGVAGTDAVAILEELGIADQRLISAFLRAGNAGDLLTDSLKTSNEAFDEGRALQDEAQKRYNTTASKMQLVKNQIKDMTAEIGFALLPIMSDLLDALDPIIKDMGKRLPEVIAKVGDFIRKKIVPAIQNLVAWLKVNIPIAIQVLTNFWNTKLLPVIKALGEFINKEVMPRIRELVAWFMANLPIAIEYVKQAIQGLAAFWRDTLLPALTAVIGFIQENLVPILSGIAVLILTIVIPAVVSWAAANVAAAAATIAAFLPIIAVAAAIVAVVALLVKAWQNDWGGIQTKTKEVWEGTLKPAFEAIKEWLEINIPKAIETVKGFWENTLQPALEAVGSFIKETVVPIIEGLVSWLKEKVPEAMQAIKSFWEGTLKPALDKMWQFIQDPLIVWVEKLYTWLKTNITEAFQAIRDFWDSTLNPALQEIRDFIEDPLLVWIKELVTWVGEKINEAWDGFKLAWETVYKPFIQRVVDFITDPLIKIIESLVTWVVEHLVGAFNTLKKWWQEHGEMVITWISGGFGKIKGVIDAIIGAIKTMADKISNLKDKLPDWLIPGSPTPLELGLLGVNAALKEANSQFATLSRGLKTLPAPTALVPAAGQRSAPLAALAGGGAGALAGGGGTTTITLAPIINNGMDLATFEARVKSVVTKAVGE